MKLIDGLKIAQRPAADGTPCLRVFLACAFPSLHLRTFLTAYLREQGPNVQLEICAGFFGDLAGNAVGNEPEGPEEAADQASINISTQYSKKPRRRRRCRLRGWCGKLPKSTLRRNGRFW